MPVPLVAGFPTHVTRSGSGARRAVFLHCSLAHSGAWAPAQAVLAERLDMVCFDRPSHGRSGAWDGEGGAAGLLDLTARIAGALAGEGADIVGHSFGGIAALRLALTRPDLVRSLTLIEPPLFAAIRGGPRFAAHAGAMERFEAALAAGDRMKAAEIFNAALSPESPWSEMTQAARAGLARRIHLIADENPVTLDDIAGLLAPGGLDAVDRPVLLIGGDLSPPIMDEVMSALAARLPAARRAVIAGAGHMSPVTHPQAVAGEIARFLGL
ncbi:alpha/beta fold hydrolase [Sinisalibacter aestuarii]|uniref:Acyl-CoA esterase n=1 Tax=Sinisalibacter aestuarii TaxID=2949426 RepID=A0ABQ5LQV0_9RHOB|nr:alpha/beta hydrolase [Sinisalibacter aestuarii]GKY86988.1 acyl-CoA esterase [Sinisalibacter aestuarii]